MSESQPTANRELDVDMATFEQAISFAGEEFRKRLLAQLIADLDRLRDALTLRDMAVQRSAAHELKGLAGTIGAERLASLAVLHEITLDTGLMDEARSQVEAMLDQIEGVSGLLVTAAGGSEAA